MTTAEARREVHTPVCCLHPYVGFVSTPNAVIDFSTVVPPEFGHGAIATIDGDGFRNEPLPEDKPSGEYWLGILGGSVAFGVPSTSNATTIAGQLQRLIEGRRADGKRVRVLNLAIPGGQQPQQFFALALNRARLDGVITFDGVNEVVVPSCYNDGQIPSHFPYLPYYQALFGRTLSDEQIAETVALEQRMTSFHARPSWQQRLLRRRHEREIAARRAWLSALGMSVPFESIYPRRDRTPLQRALDGADSWASHATLTADLCKSAGIEALLVVQPIPDRGKPLTASERAHLAVYPEIVRLRAAGYTRVLEHAARLQAAGRPVVELSSVFAACEESIYTDLVHFEDRGAAVVARQLAGHVADRWQGFQT